MNAQAILETLSKQAFHNFYEGPFADYIEGNDNAKSETEILQDIKKLFDTGETIATRKQRKAEEGDDFDVIPYELGKYGIEFTEPVQPAADVAYKKGDLIAVEILKDNGLTVDILNLNTLKKFSLSKVSFRRLRNGRIAQPSY